MRTGHVHRIVDVPWLSTGGLKIDSPASAAIASVFPSSPWESNKEAGATVALESSRGRIVYSEGEADIGLQAN